MQRTNGMVVEEHVGVALEEQVGLSCVSLPQPLDLVEMEVGMVANTYSKEVCGLPSRALVKPLKSFPSMDCVEVGLTHTLEPQQIEAPSLGHETHSVAHLSQKPIPKTIRAHHSSFGGA